MRSASSPTDERKSVTAKKKEDDTTIRFKVEGDETQYEIDPFGLTLGEMAEIEVQFSMPYNEVLAKWGDSQRFAQVLTAMAISRQRVDFSLEDVGNLRPDQIEFLDDPPTRASSPSGTKK